MPDAPLTAAEAAQLLNIKPATLYAYVSRGLVRAMEVPGSRAKRYARQDVLALQKRLPRGRRPPSDAKTSLDWGAPVLESALTLIERGRLYYRGRDIAGIEPTATLEDVAALLWGDGAEAGFAAGNLPNTRAALGLHPSARVSIFQLSRTPEKLMAILARAQAGDLQSLDRSPAGTARTGARLLRLLAAAISGRRPSGMPVHEQLGEGWQLPDAAARDAIRSALVVSADHELNASTFTVRCVASTDATPYAAVIAGLTALQGPRHGGMTGQVEAMLAEASDSADAGTVIAARLQRGDRLPGFGHPLYPDGDPRAALLLPRVSQLAEAGNRPGVLTTLAEAAWNLTGQLPNIDFALAGLAWCLGLPKGAAFSLFALGRTVGWIGHAREQYALDRLIRPRAAYVGPRPEPIGEVPV